MVRSDRAKLVVRKSRIGSLFARWGPGLAAFWWILGVNGFAHGDERSLDPATPLLNLRESINLAWLIAAGCLALLMKAGFALAESGLVRAKNAAHTAAMIVGIFAVAVLGYWLCGFAWMFGGRAGWPTLALDSNQLTPASLAVEIGNHRWGLVGLRDFGLISSEAASPALLAVFFFHLVILDAAVTIPTGAMLERWRFGPALIFGFIASAFIVPIYGGWVWGDGWLSDLGAIGLGAGMVDWAGSGVIHLTGGVMALAGALALGPRIGKLNSDGSSNAVPGHNVPMVIVGSVVLAIGGFGVNLGRTLSVFDPRIAAIATTTVLAVGTGCLTALGMTRWVFGKPDPTMGCNGLLAGLVAISASCPFVTPIEAVAIGAVAGLLVVTSILFIDKTLRIDDPVGAISVHGVCGAFGLLCVGLLARTGTIQAADGQILPVRGFFADGTLGQLGAQLIGIGANLVWVFPTSLLTFAVIGRLLGNRVAARAEIEGLDVPELGILGYVGEETYAVRTAGQDFLATFGPGVPPKSAAKPSLPPTDGSQRRKFPK